MNKVPAVNGSYFDTLLSEPCTRPLDQEYCYDVTLLVVVFGEAQMTEHWRCKTFGSNVSVLDNCTQLQ